MKSLSVSAACLYGFLFELYSVLFFIYIGPVPIMSVLFPSVFPSSKSGESLILALC